MTLHYMMAASVLIGFASGLGFFWLLKINTNLYLREGKNWIAVITHLVRFTTIVLIFWYISKFGAMPLLCSLGGFLLGRKVSLKYLTPKEL